MPVDFFITALLLSDKQKRMSQPRTTERRTVRKCRHPMHFKPEQIKGSGRRKWRTAGTLFTSERERALHIWRRCTAICRVVPLGTGSPSVAQWSKERVRKGGRRVGERMDVHREGESHTQHDRSLCWCLRLILLVGFPRTSQPGGKSSEVWWCWYEAVLIKLI